jgi:hypothetical protein
MSSSAAQPTSAPSHVPLPRRIPNLWQLAAAAYICVLLYLGVSKALMGSDYLSVSIAMVFNFFPASLYFLGFFWYLPEAIGGKRRGPLVSRWEAWLRASGELALLTLLGIGLQAIYEADNSKDRFLMAAAGTAVAYAAAAACVALFREVASGLAPAETEQPRKQLFVRAFEALGFPARWLQGVFRPRFTLPAGSMLVLASVLLITSANYGCSTTEYRGYQVLSGERQWLTAANMSDGVVRTATAAVGRGMYMLGIVLALVAAGVFVRILLRKQVSGRHALLFRGLAAAVATYTAADLALYFDYEMGVPYPLLWAVYFLVPLIVWLSWGCSRNPSRIARWREIRLALVILYLPLVLLGYGVLIVVISFKTWGYVAYFFGTQLLLWGFVHLYSALPSPADTS